MVTARRARRAGFTLVELIVYLALVSAGLVALLGLELAASNASFLESTLVDLEQHGDDLGTRFRDDLRQAKHVALEPAPTGPRPHGTILVVELATGEEVRYELEDSATATAVSDSGREGLHATAARLAREVHPKPGAPAQDRTVYRGLERFSLERDPRGGHALYVLEVGFAVQARQSTIRRAFRFAASPLAEEAP
jgi:hypothetical protein